MRKSFLCLLAITAPWLAFAQTPHPWELGVGIGTGAYEGDLQEAKQSLQFLNHAPAVSAHLRRNLSNHFSANLGLLYTGLQGDDTYFKVPAWRQTRAFSFKGALMELSARAEIYPFGLYKPMKGEKAGLSKNRRMLSPYVTVGVAGAFFNAKNDWNESNGNGGVEPNLIQKDLTERENATIAVPAGIGLRVRASNRFTLGLEGIARLTQSDYLDGVSVAADPNSNDWFYSIQITGSYSFGKEQKQQGPARRSRNFDDEIPSADFDDDGVNDSKDECPDIPGLRSMKGCPDADRDGIADKNDACPEAAGLPALNGCPDRDEDGIADQEDSCPELKGILAYRGCPAIDRDKDGVADAEDLCPDMNGQLRWKGCPDTDSDGLPDNKDGCPGIAGPEELHGCPDTDEDGIADKDDECPTMEGIPAKKGCPEALPPAPGVPYKAIYFNSTLDDWQVTSLITIDEAVAILNADPALFARIEGHTDNTGKEPANDLLAEKRAQKCRNNLVTKGIAPERLNVIGFGSKKPIVPNDTRENRQLNRRVEIHFYRKNKTSGE